MIARVRVHTLKSWPEFFEPVFKGEKTYELRRNDRDFHVGEDLLLQEYEPKSNTYTGREVRAEIKHMLLGTGADGIVPLEGLAPGFAILGIAWKWRRPAKVQE